MWTLKPTEKYATSRRYYEKKKRRELKAVDRNLATYFAALEACKPLQIKYGFIHPEALGIIAIDQKGGGKSLAETRLYVYPETETGSLHLLVIGDKNSQEADIRYSKDCVEELRKFKVVVSNDPYDKKISEDGIAAAGQQAIRGTEAV